MLQLQMHGMELVNTPQMAWCANTKPTGFPCIGSININYYPETDIGIPSTIIYGYLKCPIVDTKSIVWPSKQGSPWYGRAIIDLDTR